MESMKCQMEAGPMPPKVVKTHGRKRRPRAAEPEACFEKVDLLMLSAGPPEGGFVPKPPFHREHQDTLCAILDHKNPVS